MSRTCCLGLYCSLYFEYLDSITGIMFYYPNKFRREPSIWFLLWANFCSDFTHSTSRCEFLYKLAFWCKVLRFSHSDVTVAVNGNLCWAGMGCMCNTKRKHISFYFYEAISWRKRSQWQQIMHEYCVCSVLFCDIWKHPISTSGRQVLLKQINALWHVELLLVTNVSIVHFFLCKCRSLVLLGILRNLNTFLPSSLPSEQ